MNTLKWWAALGAALAGTAGLAGLAFGDSDEFAHARRYLHEARLDVAPVTDALYAEECGACHLAYPPGLLPERSWRRLLGGLADHFGENAELDDLSRARLTDYASTNAADRVDYKRSRLIARSLAPGEVPLRITETAYFRRKHDELPRRVVEDNPQVGSFGRCEACHAGAADGSFDEHQVNIAGVGRWDD